MKNTEYRGRIAEGGPDPPCSTEIWWCVAEKEFLEGGIPGNQSINQSGNQPGNQGLVAFYDTSRNTAWLISYPFHTRNNYTIYLFFIYNLVYYGRKNINININKKHKHSEIKIRLKRKVMIKDLKRTSWTFFIFIPVSSSTNKRWNVRGDDFVQAL